MHTFDPYLNSLADLIAHAHSPFHCCAYCMEQLSKNGFQELRLQEPFRLKPGGRYFINIYDTTCIAFVLGEAFGTSPDVPNLRMITSHTDWPTFLIKPNPELCADEYGRLNVEPYGGAVYTSWLDRPLGIAGKLCTKGTDPFHPRVHLIDSGKPVAIIPGLAIHMNRETNDGLKLNPQLHMLPLVSLQRSKAESDFFHTYLADLAGIAKEEILDYELCLYNADESTCTGIDGSLFSSPRIDNCSGVQAALEAILSAVPDSNGICISAFYHNEEIGSTTKQGADSDLTFNLLQRVFENLGSSMEQLYCALADGICLSLDVAHAMHPNYPDKNDLTNHICPGDGVALKLSSRQAYATDASYVSMIQALCEENHIPCKKYVNRSDMRGGSTLGSIISAKLNIPCVDAGVPLLSMHSARELMAGKDQAALCALALALFHAG